MDKLQQQWKQARQEVELSSASIQDIIAKAGQKKKSIVYFHYANIMILTLTLIVISLFFYYIMSYQKWISVVGAILMAGGLALRIIIEIISTFRSKKIQLLQDVSSTTEAAIIFYTFRKKIHGPVTISIVALYMIGFYLLTPEFSDYFSLTWMLIMDISFFIGAFILIWVIRKGIKREMLQLLSLTELKQQIMEKQQ